MKQALLDAGVDACRTFRLQVRVVREGDFEAVRRPDACAGRGVQARALAQYISERGFRIYFCNRVCSKFGPAVHVVRWDARGMDNLRARAGVNEKSAANLEAVFPID